MESEDQKTQVNRETKESGRGVSSQETVFIDTEGKVVPVEEMPERPEEPKNPEKYDSTERRKFSNKELQELQKRSRGE